MDAEPPISFSSGRRWGIALNALLSVVSLLAIMVMLNYLAARHPLRWHLHPSPQSVLTPLTQRVLSLLTNDVKMIVFFDRNDPLFPQVSDFSREYQSRSSKIKLEFVDYHFPGRAELVRSQYHLTATTDSSRIIFDSNGRSRMVLAAELSDYDLSNVKEIRRTGFKGEQMFTSALVSVTEGRQMKVYFSKGHGEMDPDSDSDQRGLSNFRRLLQESYIDVGTLTVGSQGDIPADCQLLIIAGPEKPFAQPELERLQKYLLQGGRMMLMFPLDLRRTGLERLLAEWNVEVGFNQVRDASQARAGAEHELLANDFGNHPITKPLLRSSLHMAVPRSIAQKTLNRGADAAKVVELVFTSAAGEAIGRFDQQQRGEIERSGKIPLIVAVERGGIQGIAADRGTTRMVVAGNSLFLSNALFEQAANRDFAQLTVNWLLSRDILLGDIPPRAVQEYQISLTEHQLGQLRWIFLAAIPGGVLLFGGLVWLRRRA